MKYLHGPGEVVMDAVVDPYERGGVPSTSELWVEVV